MWRNNNNQADMGRLMDACADASSAIREAREMEKQVKAQRAGYAAALAQAKVTGVMPEEFQTTVPVDQMMSQVGVKVVALRELEKLAGENGHPLLKQTVRSNIATQSRINFNMASRPTNVDLATFVPSDKAAQIIFSLPE